MRDAYRTLLRDVMRGNLSLFVSSPEVECAWERYVPLLDVEDVEIYPVGSWGPASVALLPGGAGAKWGEDLIG